MVGSPPPHLVNHREAALLRPITHQKRSWHPSMKGCPFLVKCIYVVRGSITWNLPKKGILERSSAGSSPRLIIGNDVGKPSHHPFSGVPRSPIPRSRVFTPPFHTQIPSQAFLNATKSHGSVEPLPRLLRRATKPSFFKNQKV